MAFSTMQQLITAVQTTLYQAAGPQVQFYSQDILQQMVQDAFDHIFEMRWWPRFSIREVVTLDGVTGQPTTAIPFINDYRDVRYVYLNNDPMPLSKLPADYNISRLSSGSCGQFVEMLGNSKLFRVLPMTTTGTASIVGRIRPDAFDPDDTVPFDALLIRHMCAWSYFTDDGSSPASAAKHQGLFENRLRAVEDSEFSGIVALDQNNTRDFISSDNTGWGNPAPPTLLDDDDTILVDG